MSKLSDAEKNTTYKVQLQNIVDYIYKKKTNFITLKTVTKFKNK